MYNHFFGMARYYRCHILDNAKIARPLSELTKKDKPFIWNNECQGAFDALKLKLTNNPVLWLVFWNKPFILMTAASYYAVGAILEQPVDGKNLPVGYASQKLKPSEVKYSTTQKKAFTCLFGVTHFNYYLLGRKFTLIMDHAPLHYLMTTHHYNMVAHWHFSSRCSISCGI